MTSAPAYPPDSVGPDEDDGTMPGSVAALADAVIGRRIVKAEKTASIRSDDFVSAGGSPWWRPSIYAFVLTLDDGRRVAMVEEGDCCAYTTIKNFLLHPESVDHAITGVATEDGYTKWHILADFGDVLTLDVEWSCGNLFYSYGFTIGVSNTIDGVIVEQPSIGGGAQ